MPNEQLTVSVVMCTHNGMEFIEEQLESILSQTRQPYELIISDDNSTDGTLDFATAYVKERKNADLSLSNLKFRAISNIPGLGVTKNFERAISFAQGELVALSDQDDIWITDRLQQVTQEFELNPHLVLIHSDAMLVNEHNESLNLTLFESLRASKKELDTINSANPLKVFLRRNLVTGATTIFRKELFHLAAPFPQELLHDEWLGLVASSTGKRIKVLRSPLIRYRQHSRNQVGASKLGIRHAIGRIVFPGKKRNEILFARAQAISNHPAIVEKALPKSKISIQDKLEHEQVRSDYPASRLKRFPLVLKEVKTNRYSQFGLGFQDVLRDLLQPLT